MTSIFALDSFSGIGRLDYEHIDYLINDAWKSGFKEGALDAKSREIQTLSSKISGLQADLRWVDERRDSILKNEILTITPVLLAIFELFSAKHRADVVLKSIHNEIEKILINRDDAGAIISCPDELVDDVNRIIDDLNCTNISVGASTNTVEIEFRTLNGRTAIEVDGLIEACRLIIAEADVWVGNG